MTDPIGRGESAMLSPEDAMTPQARWARVIALLAHAKVADSEICAAEISVDETPQRDFDGPEYRALDQACEDFDAAMDALFAELLAMGEAGLLDRITGAIGRIGVDA